MESKTAYSRAEVRRILKINENRLRSWERAGLCAPQEQFEFVDLIALKTLQKLRENRIPTERIEQALRSLREKLSDIDRPLWELKIVSDGRKVAVRLPGGKMEALTGQMLFDFDVSNLRSVAAFEAPRRAESPGGSMEESEFWFHRGLEREERGEPLGAVLEAYGKALQANPAAAGVWVNMGTVHYREGNLREAEHCYRQALQAFPGYALAHFNLGNVCEETGRLEEAAERYKTAISLDDSYADAHYNLALAEERLDRPMDAVKHWRRYLQLDPSSAWADIARRALNALQQVMQGGAFEPRSGAPRFLFLGC